MNTNLSETSVERRIEIAYGVGANELRSTFEGMRPAERTQSYPHPGFLLELPTLAWWDMKTSERNEMLTDTIRDLVREVDDYKQNGVFATRTDGTEGREPPTSEALEVLSSDVSEKLIAAVDVSLSRNKFSAHAGFSAGRRPFPLEYKGHKFTNWSDIRWGLGLLPDGKLLAQGFGYIALLGDGPVDKDSKLKLAQSQPVSIPTSYLSSATSGVRINTGVLNEHMLKTAEQHDLAMTPLHSEPYVSPVPREGDERVDTIYDNASLQGAIYDRRGGMGLRVELSGHVYLGDDNIRSNGDTLWPEFAPLGPDEVVVLPRTISAVESGDVSVSTSVFRSPHSEVPLFDRRVKVNTYEYSVDLTSYGAKVIAAASVDLHERLADELGDPAKRHIS